MSLTRPPNPVDLLDTAGSGDDTSRGAVVEIVTERYASPAMSVDTGSTERVTTTTPEARTDGYTQRMW